MPAVPLAATTKRLALGLRFSARHPRGAGPTPSGRDLAYLALNLISAGDTSGAREALRQAVVRASTEYVREDLIANASMRLGDREAAIQWLVKAAASHVGGIDFALEDALYAPIWSDPRIKAIIGRLSSPK
jgi:Tfp pilus assembly protein PilF